MAGLYVSSPQQFQRISLGACGRGSFLHARAHSLGPVQDLAARSCKQPVVLSGPWLPVSSRCGFASCCCALTPSLVERAMGKVAGEATTAAGETGPVTTTGSDLSPMGMTVAAALKQQWLLLCLCKMNGRNDDDHTSSNGQTKTFPAQQSLPQLTGSAEAATTS